MNANWFRWVVRLSLVAVMAALLIVTRFGYPSPAFPSWHAGGVAVVGLIGAGVVAAGFLVYQSRWR